MTGQIALVRCEGSDTKADLIKREKIANVCACQCILAKLQTYINLCLFSQPRLCAQIHNGLVEAIAANRFVSGLFLSVGRNVLALWSTELLWTPIFWRCNSAHLTSVCWSKDRPSVFFVTCGDGSFEAWDILGKAAHPGKRINGFGT